MKRGLSILLAVIVCAAANAQTLQVGKNDLEKNNLKGDVVSVTEYSCAVKEAFGEWERGERFPSSMSVFNGEGNFLLYTEEPIRFTESSYTDYITDVGRVPVIKTIQLYYYDEAGRLTSINCLYNRMLGYAEDIVEWLFNAYQEEFIVKTIDYNADGTIKSITSDRKIGKHYNEEALGICAKEVFKYDSDGPEIWFYNRDGRRDTDRIYKILVKDRCIIKRGDEGVGVELYNEKGQLIAMQRSATLVNGQFKGDIYYDYNEQGDLQVIANNTKATAAIKGMEALYPYIGDRINENTVRYFGYEYDAKGNWVVMKTYSIRGQEVIISGWKERDIKYASDGFSGEEMVSKLIDDVNGLIGQARSKQAEKEAYRSRPQYPELTDAFFGWLQSIVSYPGAETPLGSILAAPGSILKIGMLLNLNPEGTFIPPTSFQQASRYASEDALTWELRNNKFYILQTTAEKEEKKAQEQIEQILNQLLLDLKDAPAVTKGQQSTRTSVTILLENGQITAREGY